MATSKNNTSKGAVPDSEFDWAAPAEGEGEEIQTGFPPYWHVEEGARFMGIVCGKDDSNEKFIRYIVQATRPMKAYRGAGRSEEAVVQPGDYFTVGVYNNLQLDNMIGCEIYVEVTGKIKADTPAGFVWGFKARKIRENLPLPKLASGGGSKALPESDTNGNMAEPPIR